MNSGHVNVVCLKWGTCYPDFYVNRLYAGVRRHLSRPFRFVCFTNEPEGLAAEVEVQPIPPRPEGLVKKLNWPTVYTKLALFKDGCGELAGPTLFLDLDQIVVGDLDRFFDYRPGQFCIIRNWIERRKQIFRRRPMIGNSSCFRFEAGTMNWVWETFRSNLDSAYDKRLYPTEQAFMTHVVGVDNVNWWPENWVVSFKRRCHRIFPMNLILPPRPPKGVQIICFHGNPNPHEAIGGFRVHHGKKVPLHQITLPAPWIRNLWENG